MSKRKFSVIELVISLFFIGSMVSAIIKGCEDSRKDVDPIYPSDYQRLR